ncbi:thiopurine S-methyltransferase [Psychrobacter sp. CCUG 69069]|jgi:thiopurine S-methyltransferase|uniref:thiopurine S-methyltransferase n=1 Tax=Psychrobacter sp. CCUG 69069 TaxID=2282777 RepID=UPI001E31C907|nr:thiopurine S-methyltransferase [Psychrobacter sp. CCUG 69069]MCD1279480.1 thiopurine S-methyltransferase [Psychrobacter sp. CCUG 69069]|tara:strand:+ start:990 stop:1658 length:669 start_codon:yes stop_codon:yes gene_type:complete
MNPEFWQNRWQEKRIGFNQSEVNSLLIKYWSALNLPASSRVFVPLCGKSIDMVWLSAQGYDVVGVELVESAVQAFFAEQNIQPTIYQHAENIEIKCYQGELGDSETKRTITLWVADIFALTSTDIGSIDVVYDKAALIALPADMRTQYSEQVCLLSGTVPQLVITLNYDQSKKDGPPFSVSCEQVQQYYGSRYQITELAREPAAIGSAPDLTVSEQVWLLSE